MARHDTAEIEFRMVITPRHFDDDRGGRRCYRGLYSRLRYDAQLRFGTGRRRQWRVHIDSNKTKKWRNPVNEPRQTSELRTLRTALSNEWHARPQIVLPAPLRCSHLLCLRDGGSVGESRAAFAEFCRAESQAEPAIDSRHHSIRSGACMIKWEGHTEVDSYTILVAGNGEPPFSASALGFLDAAQAEALTARLLVGVHVEVLAYDEVTQDDELMRVRSLLGTDEVYGGLIAGGSASLWSSFRLDADGFQRVVIGDRGQGQARLSRNLQRVLETESYRVLAMLALPEARDVMVKLSALEPELDAAMQKLAHGDTEDIHEEQLGALTRIAARVERIVDKHTYRFAASRAYAGIVERRIGELDETSFGGAPRYGSFLLKSLLPAMRTCDAAENRTKDLAQRVSRATQLLDSMVDMVQKKQNQAILESMAKRANLQLRLQQSVEGFSIMAISYYAVGLLGYLLKSGKSLGLGVNPDLLTGIAAPAILALVWLSIRRVTHHLRHDRD